MFSSEEVSQIRDVARSFPDPNNPSSHLMEFLVEKADEPGCGLEELCMEIDKLAAAGKLAKNSGGDNVVRADLLIDLMRLFPDAPDEIAQREVRRKRAMALRSVNRLRGFRQYDERRRGR